MNDLLKTLLGGLQGARGGSKLTAALVAASLLAILAVAAWVSRRPHYQIAFSGLDDHEVAAVNKALSESGVPFEVSQPPAPFTVYVDEDRRTAAYMAVYGAGALDKPLEGILSGDGVSSVFHSAEERAQGVRKREWEEMEKMLEELDFVLSASVRTAPVSSTPLSRDRENQATASVTLRLAHEAELTGAQSATVANLVSRGLGIPREHLVVSDQSGQSLYDGQSDPDDEPEAAELLDHQVEHDQRLARSANAVLDGILGPNKARVSVSSEWDFSQSTLRTETSQKGAVLQETRSTSEKPAGLAGSGPDPVGLSANTLDPDVPGTGAPGARAPETPASEPLLEKTSEERKEYAPSVSREERVRFAPELLRLSVALFLDQTLPERQQAGLESTVKAAVGFDEERDVFSSVVLPFAAPGESTPAPEATEEKSERANPLLETLLRRGIEIASALVFIVLLLKSLKSARSPGTAAGETGTASAIDAERLAQAQVEELLRSDPARVGEILSRWAREEPVAKGS